tara:strand:- start:228 stop:692 length:465 start_codon:yes stop_codon:yes gene_type:complete
MLVTVDKKEFQAFTKMIDEAYPSQASLNQVQKGFFWLALKNYNLDECVLSLSNYTKYNEWKPKVCDIVAGLNSTNSHLAKLFDSFFTNKKVEDKIAIKVYKNMGGQSLNRTLLEKDYEEKTKQFIELYNNEVSRENYNKLPKKLKSKLIGLEDN